jgi:DNA-binding transcriptional ArsR family regulator
MPNLKGSQLIAWLRAAGEPSRLRLLILCSQRELSVSDLAEALGQSEPRVSRHLRILCEAGLLERSRQGQWVHYSLPGKPEAAAFVQGLLAQLDRTDPQIGRDLQRGAQPAGAEEAVAPSYESRLGRALDDFAADRTEVLPGGCALLDGLQHLELLERGALLTGRCVAIAGSRRAAQSARAFAERRGFNCQVLVSSSPDGSNERDLLRAAQSVGVSRFDVIILDRIATGSNDAAAVLRAARERLAPQGRLFLFERYDSLEGPRDKGRDKVVEHPLARLRRLLSEADLSCERLSPVEADGQHVLAALAVPVPVASETALRRA